MGLAVKVGAGVVRFDLGMSDDGGGRGNEGIWMSCSG